MSPFVIVSIQEYESSMARGTVIFTSFGDERMPAPPLL
jgi:hypothetical protein